MNETDVLGQAMGLLQQMGLDVYIKAVLLIIVAFVFLDQVRKLRE